MADTEQRVRIIIEADGTGRLVDGTRLSAEEMRKLGEQLTRTGLASERAGQQMAGLGKDMAQGDWRGAAERMGTMAMRAGAVQAAATGMGAALGVAGAAAIALGAAIYQAREETERQADAMLLTGNYAGLVGGQLNQMARDAAAGMNGSVGNTRQTMEALVASGRVTTESLAEMAKGVELVSRFSGQSRESVTKDFASMAGGVAKWAAEHNQSYHFITYDQYKYIESLEKAGKTQEAMRVTSTALNQHLGNDLKRNLGYLETAWKGVGDWASKTWDSMLGLGREKTVTDNVASITAQLEALEKRKPTGRTTAAQREELRQNLLDQQAYYQELQRLEKRQVEGRSQRAQEEERKIAADRDKKKDGNSDFAANFINRLTTQYANLSGQMSKTEEVTRQLDVSSGKFSATQRAEALSLARLIDEKNNSLKVSQEWTRQLQRQEQAQQAANDAFTANVISLGEQTRGYEFQIGLIGRSTEEVQRLTAARNTKLSLDRMLLDLQRQLDQGAITEQEAMEREIALRNLSNDALKEQLRLMDEVELRRRDMMAGARDGLRDYETTAARVGDATANAVKSGFKAAEDALVEFAKTGKLEMSSLATSIASDLLRIQIQQGMTGPAAGFLSKLFSGGGSSSSGGFGTGSDYGNADYGSFFHEGGIVGGRPTFSRPVSAAVFNGAPRFHGGGITGDEVPIIAKRGEGVFTPGQMRALGAGMGGGATIVQNVKVINNTGSQVSVRQQSGNNGFDMSLILDAVDSGMADRVGAGEGALPRALEGRYNLRTAVN